MIDQSNSANGARDQVASADNKLNTLNRYQVLSKIAIGIAVAFFIGLGIHQLMSRLETTPSYLSAGFFLGITLAVVYRVINAYGWALILNSLGGKVDGEAATRIWLLAESRRWLPGGIWGYTSRAAMAPRMGVSVAKASASMFLELIVLMLAAVIVSVPGVILYWGKVADALYQLTRHVPVHWIAIFAALCALCVPICWNKFSSKWRTVQQRYDSLRQISFDKVSLIRAIVFFVAMAGLNGLVTGCLLHAVPGGDGAPMWIVIAATSVAWIIGFLAVFSPGGLIVREGALALLLLPWIPYSTGFTAAILARLVQIFSEIVCLAWVVVTDRLHAERTCVPVAVEVTDSGAGM